MMLQDRLREAIPGCTPAAEPPPAHGDAIARLDWFERIVGEGFSAYVEWKDLDGWVFSSIGEMAPIVGAGVTLSLDEIYDADSDDADDWPLSAFNEQLAPAGLALLQLCAWEKGRIVGSENPHLVCVRADANAIAALNAALREVGLTLV